MSGYRTIDREVGLSATGQIDVKRSIFRCEVTRVESEQAAREVITATRASYKDARHHCTAFVIGPRADLCRSNDDGEPSGTAGRPMLEALQGRGVSDVVAVVTRWFGGTLLGTGPLARAYADAVNEALDNAGTRERRLAECWTVRVRLNELGTVENQLRSVAEVREVNYGPHAAEFSLVLKAGRQLPPLVEAEPAEPQWLDLA